MFLHIELAEEEAEGRSTFSALKLVTAMACLTLFAVLIVFLFAAGKAPPQLAALVAKNISNSGVENPVTAVLLNFRSYDTLLEVGVLVIVAAAMLKAREQAVTHRFLVINKQILVDPVLDGLLRWLVPLAIIVAGYLLWTGAYAPGGAFQAGAMIAAAGVALSLTGRYQFSWSSAWARILLGGGLAVFVLAGGICVIFTGEYLMYPRQSAGLFILLIELAATISIAAILLLLFTSIQSSTTDSLSDNPTLADSHALASASSLAEPKIARTRLC